ncbi:ATP-binding protein [Phenylobacterium sp. J367]|uniref:ATP-binding response regulator n=1 Tax=Phenylobacterium sp. J367 TaxID=2898435 RepID=UPI002150770C|nr:ATP-binding protein [Phenylobacterium sp. J367]MCR5881036.1 ATP-binding protein [Phenylobacterium sp. J367]
MEPARGRYVGDPTRIRQILYNLISNAVKFTEAGEIRVTARRRGETLEIAVTDTGVGISEEGLARLFAKFDQLDSSTTRKFGGTGLGLAICHELAVLMGGEIRVESTLGMGSSFVLCAPLARVGEERLVAEYAPPPPNQRAALELRVLAAEDNTVNQLVLKTLLHQLGVEPVVVDCGQAAVDAWETSDWDVILMDIQMPDMDGVTATQMIRERERDTGRARTPHRGPDRQRHEPSGGPVPGRRNGRPRGQADPGDGALPGDPRRHRGQRRGRCPRRRGRLVPHL